MTNIYLAGPIAGAGKNYKDWKKLVQGAVDAICNDKAYIIQLIDPERYELSDSATTAHEICRRNLEDIFTSDIVILYWDGGSTGGTVEALIARALGKKVFVLVPPWAMSGVSVWVRFLFPDDMVPYKGLRGHIESLLPR